MNTSLGKRLVSLVLALVMVLGMVPVVANPKAEAAESYFDGVASDIQSLSMPSGVWKSTLPGTVDGLWIIVSMADRTNLTAGDGYTMNATEFRGWNASGTVVNSGADHYGFNCYNVKLSGAMASIASQDMFVRIKGSTGACSFQMMDGKYWYTEVGGGREHGNLKAADTEQGNFVLTQRSEGTYSVQFPNIGYLVSNGHSFRVYKKSADVAGNKTYHFRFYKVSEKLLDLWNALQEALPYVDNSDRQYYEAYHQALIDQLKGDIPLYRSFQNKNWAEPTAAEAQTISDHAAQIRQLIERLNMSGSQRTYIDIPIEVLDFRGDGFLFESQKTFGTPYSLSRDYQGTINGNKFPGTQENGPTIDQGHPDDFRILGLVEDELYKGNVVYRDETIDYIAAAIKERIEIKSVSGRMNGAFIGKLKDITELGDLDSTIQKLEPQVKGGVLLWNQVETCYDLAYYMLSSVWREVPRKDVLGRETRLDGDPTDVHYNLPVPELNHLRLYYVNNPDSGKTEYVYNSYFDSAYENGYIYNTSTNEHGIDPSFRAMNNLGYEAPGFFGANTEGRDLDGEHGKANYCFSIHAYGGFVYSESADYYFNFSGDDDVYFFINGELVCDIGGIHGRTHKGIELNDYAAKLNLKDGQICTFDMFYAERRTTGINMELYTNIQLMDMDVITGKQQYEAATGKKLVDGAAVNIGTETDYSFSILNRRIFPVQDVSFDDPAIGTTLSKDGILLNGKTALSDLRITYTAYDYEQEQLYTGKATEASDPTDLIEKLSAYMTPDNSEPMKDCAFTYQFKTGDSLSQLQELLALGIPAGCELMLYGFNRTVNGGLFTNTMNSSCVPLTVQRDENEVPTLVPEAPIPGTASCRIYGIDLGTVSVGAPRSYVIDYGKSVNIPMAEVREGLTCDSGMTADFVGVTMNGENGAIKPEAPITLIGTAELPSATGDAGVFTLSGETLSYEPKSFLSTVESCYAVYCLRASSNNAIIAYVYAEIQIIPANMMYYEAESFTNELSLTKKTTDKDTGAVTIQRTWEEENLKKVGMTSGALQDHVPDEEKILIPDYRNNEKVLFFGFDNRPEDRERYTMSIYGNRGNYDDPTKANALWYTFRERPADAKVQKHEIKSDIGAMVITARAQAGTSADAYPDIFLDTIYDGNPVTDSNTGFYNSPLSYNPKDAEVYQVRFKMKNFRLGTKGTGTTIATETPFVTMEYSSTTTGNTPKFTRITWSNISKISPIVMTEDEYVVITLPLDSAFRSASKITRIRAYWGGIESASASALGELTVDYIYIGPYDLAPTEEAYGWDGSYLRNDKLSNGQSLYVEGNGIRIPADPNPGNYSEINFSFTGTGFDLITRTGAEQGAMRVEVYKDEDRNTPVKVVTVNNKGELELYQIPTVSIQDLEHGKYYVSAMVNDKVESAFAFLSRGNQLYLDAIRIYDPIDVSEGAASADPCAQAAYSAYCGDREAHPVIKEVRELLLTAKDFQALDGSTIGAVYVDYSEVPTETVPATDENGDPTGTYVPVPDPAPDLDNHIVTTIATYEKLGPKNEVYLSKNQMVAFRLDVYSRELPKRLDVGCKNIDGSSAQLSVLVAKDANTQYQPKILPVYSNTAQYYTVPLWNNGFMEGVDEEGRKLQYIYVVIQNQGEGVLSVTDIKIAYDGMPTLLTPAEAAANSTEPQKRNGTVELPMDSFVEFTVDGEVSKVIDGWANSGWNSTCKHTPGQWTVGEIREELYCVHCGVLLETRSFTPASELYFAGASVSLQSDLAINYKVDEAFFKETGYTEPYVVIEDNGAKVTLREYEIREGKYVFVYRNIAPHRIGDTVTATLYAYYGDTLYCSESRDYSVADYCYNMLGKTEGNAAYEELRTLLVDILLYGAEAQRYTAYRTDSLCTDRLTEAQLALGTSACRELENHKNQTYETIDNPTVQWKGAGLNLRESVAIRFKLEAESYEDLEVRITLAGKTYSIYAKDFDHRDDGTYVHFRTINAAQMSELVYAAVYRNGEQVSHTICYSIESYAYAKQNDSTYPHLADLVKRMICYGDSTRAYVD